ARVYVPNSEDGTVDVIDPVNRLVVAHFPVGLVPHHITPSWDLKRLYVDNTSANTLTVLDPRPSLPVETIRITDPYNLYFTPDGTAAVVVAERLNRLDVYDRSSWRLLFSVSVPWPGADHLDFSADGHILMSSAEFSGAIVQVDLTRRMVVGYAYVGGLPVDVRLAPDGSVFFVANQGRHGVSVLDPERMEEIAFIPTGLGAHGLALNRDASRLYVSNRLAGTISVIDVASRQVAATWTVGGSPDMMQVSPDGRELWTSNRFGHTVSVVETTTGRVLGRGARPPRVPADRRGHRGVRRVYRPDSPRRRRCGGRPGAGAPPEHRQGRRGAGRGAGRPRRRDPPARWRPVRARSRAPHQAAATGHGRPGGDGHRGVQRRLPARHDAAPLRPAGGAPGAPAAGTQARRVRFRI